MIDIGLYDYSEDIALPKWSDYKEIETFQDYELTQYIVYELAIRNPRYKEEVDFVMEFYTQFKEEIDISIVYLSKPKKGFISPDPKLSTRRPYDGRFSELKKLILNIEVIPFNLEENTLEYKDPKIFGEEFYELLDFIMENEHRKDLNMPDFLKPEKHVDIVDIYEGDGFYIETKTKSCNGTGFNIPENCTFDSLPSIISSTTSKDFYDYAKKYDEVATSDKVDERLKRIDVLNSHIHVYEKFKRPKLRLNSSTSKNIMAEIDLSRSEKEISAYIKHLKGAIRKNIDIIFIYALFSLFSSKI